MGDNAHAKGSPRFARQTPSPFLGVTIPSLLLPQKRSAPPSSFPPECYKMRMWMPWMPL